MHCHKNYYNLQQEQNFILPFHLQKYMKKYEHAQNTQKITNRDPDLTTFHHQFLYLDKMLTFVRVRESASEQVEDDDVMRSEVLCVVIRKLQNTKGVPW